MLFSQRTGLTPYKKEIQLNSIDDELKNGLWNIYRISFLEEIGKLYEHTDDAYASAYYCYNLWHNFFKKKVEEIPYHYMDTIKKLGEYFYSCEWFRIYDIIDFTFEMLQSDDIFQRASTLDIEQLASTFNSILKREFSAYRIINCKVVPISNETEIQEIESALEKINSFTSLSICNTHLTSALQKLSDRANPDYRNSIKESISAVEGVVKIICGSEKDTLGTALDKIKARLQIHTSLEKALKNIYGYTSDSGGIRHALTEEANLDFEDAKFMLVSCSSFINYLIVKADKAGVKL